MEWPCARLRRQGAPRSSEWICQRRVERDGAIGEGEIAGLGVAQCGEGAVVVGDDGVVTLLEEL